MRRLLLTIAYDGTDFCGWQVQPGRRTVEGVLNETLSDLMQEKILVIGASRTDSGVHALANVAVFDTSARIPASRVTRALNQRLPEDVVVQSCKQVDLDFHPRHQNTKKTYEYLIYNAENNNPVSSRYHHFVYKPLDVERMQAAADLLVGEHDFVSFSSSGGQAKTSVRTIYQCRISRSGAYVTITVVGNGFLYNMVRIIAGTLIRVGCGKKEPKWVTEILDAAPQKVVAGPKVPGKGLTLIGIEEQQ